MVFSSIEFIFGFLPLFLLVYYILPCRMRNAWLFVGSILFYAFGSWENPGYVLLFLLSLVFNYGMGSLVSKGRGKIWFVFAVSANLLCLMSFKYWLRVLPIGISFYTFQAISYLCDVQRKKCQAAKSFLHFGVYLSMFPQLIAGPIVQYPAISSQIGKRSYGFHGFVQGLQIFVMGLGSKVLLANQIGLLWNQLSVIGYDSISTPLAWLGIVACSFQIYFDFWGYSLMAIGLGNMLGFELPQNFNYPYLAVSMTEFWRRWHITLGTWFKEYVYIPLGGNRKGKCRTVLNLFVVWVLTGIWHGANWNFALWGLLLFALIVIEKAGLKKILDKYKLLGHLYMFMAIPISWAVFAHSDGTELLLFLKRLFGMGATGYVYGGDYIKYGKEYGFCLFFCFFFATRAPQKIWKKLKRTYTGQIILTGIFAAVVYCLYKGLNNPFLYYQF